MAQKMKQTDIASLARSATGAAAMYRALKTADDANEPDPTIDELIEIGKEAEARDIFGHDAKRDSKGNYIQQGIGSKGHESWNHFAAIRRYEGEAKYQTAIRKMWKENPQRATAIGLEQPARLGE